MKIVRTALALGLFVSAAGMTSYAYAASDDSKCKLDPDRTAQTQDDPTCAPSDNSNGDNSSAPVQN
jgi:hypothetical protein